jgi:hypothetical protein
MPVRRTGAKHALPNVQETPLRRTLREPERRGGDICSFCSIDEWAARPADLSYSDISQGTAPPAGWTSKLAVRPPGERHAMTGTRTSINGIDLKHEVQDGAEQWSCPQRRAQRRDVPRGDDPPTREEHQVIDVDLQGHGHTAARDRPVTLANFAGDVVGLLDYLGIDQADRFGFSLGASLRPRRRSPTPTGRAGWCPHRATSGPTATTRPNLSPK